MSRIEVEHQGYKIGYSENGDKWYCFELNLEATTLSLLKQKISKYSSAERQLPGVDVYVIGYGDIERATATSIASDRSGVWCVINKGKNTRRKFELRSIVIVTPESTDAVNALLAARKEADAARKRADAASAAIPRATIEALTGVAVGDE